MLRPLMITLRIRPLLLWTCVLVWFGVCLTGAWWWWDQDQQMNDPELRAVLLIKLHGLLAQLTILLSGMLLSTHVRAGWARRRNRASGVLTLAVLGSLMLTGLGLYYANMALREWMHHLHVWIGLAAILLVPLHAVLGRWLRRRTFRS